MDSMNNKEFLIGFSDFLQKKESNNVFLQDCLIEQEKNLEELKEKHQGLIKQISLDVKSSTLIQQIFDKISDSGFRFLEDLINQGLATVYPNQPLTCSIKTGKRGNEKTAMFLLNNGEHESPVSECGGGPNEVIAFVLRVYYIVKNNLRRIIFLDESFTAISGIQIDCFINFLNMLVDNLGFNFVWITHNHSVTEYCDNVYFIHNGVIEKNK